MPNYVLYRNDIETIDSDEQETHKKIIEVMTEGQNNVRQRSGHGHAVRISHAKAHGFLKGELIVRDDLPPELAQGLFSKAGTYPVLVRLAQVPGEVLDDSKVSSPRGIAIKVFNAEGTRLAGFENLTTQDWLFDTGKEFITGGAKAFLEAFKPNAEIAPKLSETTKGVVSDVSRGTNAALNAVGVNSGKLDFYGHPKKHPLAEPYYSQTPFRYGDYIAKLGVVPASSGLKAFEDQDFDPETPNALREATVAFFRSNPAEFDFVVQLNTGLDRMPLEDAMVPWPEEDSQYQTVASLVISTQDAFDPTRQDMVDGNLSFSPAHALEAHRPLGSINRARLVVYSALADLRRQQNRRPAVELTSVNEIP